MAIFKCKMCGGDLEINEKVSVGVCKYCGSTMTIPSLDDDKRANLYDRANHFRRNNEFDKATVIYETLLNEDTSDAEAYWSLVLCKFGIEYVEDPKTNKRIPTCNRTQYTSIFADENYKQAIANADSSARSLYIAEARIIDEIQKGILDISAKEAPFDIFICYKESDSSGRRTQDSVLAQDLYYQLVQENLKVFFSRITLEDKLGTAYEPYIFAALNSSKVMVVIGTKLENFNSPWVKNEWSRYLALIKNGAKKIIIPAYKDIDPYDLPEEFSNIQAQDMGKLGFMQDLIRGIKKIVITDQPIAAAKENQPAQKVFDKATVLKRAYLCLEAGEFKKADEYLENVLDNDPENSEAYIGKLMAGLGVRLEESLVQSDKVLTSYVAYNNAVRFASGEHKIHLLSLNQKIIDRKSLEVQATYGKAINSFDTCEYEQAKQIFRSLGDYRDSKQYVDEIIPSAQYNWAVDLVNKGEFIQASQIFAILTDYKDSREYVTIKIPAAKYEYAKKLVAQRDYEKAKRIFAELGDYKDSKKQLRQKHTLFATTIFRCIILAFTCRLYLSFISTKANTFFDSIFESGGSVNLSDMYNSVIDLLFPALLCIPLAIFAVLVIDKNQILSNRKIISGVHWQPFIWTALSCSCLIYYGISSSKLNLDNKNPSGVFIMPFLIFAILLIWCNLLLKIVSVIIKKIPKSEKSFLNRLSADAAKYIRLAINVVIVLLVAAVLIPSGINVYNESKPYFTSLSSKPIQLYGTPVFSTADASSTLPQRNSDIYLPSQAVDGNSQTAWVEGASGDGIGEWIQFKSMKEQKITGIKIVNGFNKTRDLYFMNNRPQRITVMFDDVTQTTEDLEDEYNQYQDIRFDKPVIASTVKIIITSVYSGSKYDDAGFSEIVFY